MKIFNLDFDNIVSQREDGVADVEELLSELNMDKTSAE